MSLLDKVLDAIVRRMGVDPRGTRVDETTYIAIEGRDSFRITEGDRSVLVTAERGQNPSRVIYESSFNSWEPPRETDAFTSEDRVRLLAKLQKYLDDESTTYSVVE